MTNGTVFNIQRYSVQDGPGIRTTVFLKGCALCCPWCHNPESRSPRPEIVAVETRCVVCGQCQAACPWGDTSTDPLPPSSQNENCTLCGACVEACPTGARQSIGRSVSVTQVMDEVLKDRLFYDESGGGVTFSGGEPLHQAAFLQTLLDTCRQHGVHTAVDTSGHAPQPTLLAVARRTDLFLYDLKLMDEAQHQHHTGVPRAAVVDNLKALGTVHDQIWLRIPIIPGITDDPAQLASMADLAMSLPSIRQVNLLPYHHTGVPKLRRLGLSPSLDTIKPPTPELMEQARNIFKERGLITSIGG